MSLHYRGKVRDVYVIDNNTLLLEATDRLSALNAHRCVVPGKGAAINMMSAHWLNKTKGWMQSNPNLSKIIPNHYLWHAGRFMVVRRCAPIKLEIIVRGYITGSLWRAYESGQRNMYGLTFPDNLSKDQKIDPIVTPTTKDDEDRPITEQEIVADYLTLEEWEYIKECALELYNFGAIEAEQVGLTLVDTKYEFGWVDGKIILIDELHTCDSSRYWYQGNSIDKDIIRRWLLANPNQTVPNELITEVAAAYKKYTDIQGISVNDNVTTYQKAIELYQKQRIPVRIIAGSTSDAPFVNKIVTNLNELGIASKTFYGSAHKEPHRVLNYIKSEEDDRRVIWVTVAGKSNALSGVVAANCKGPVIACPPFKDDVDMMVNINSTLQCPSCVPVATILRPDNLAIFIQRLFALT